MSGTLQREEHSANISGILRAGWDFIITYLLQNKESKKELLRIYLPVKLVHGRMSIKKENVSSYPWSYLIYKIFV